MLQKLSKLSKFGFMIAKRQVCPKSLSENMYLLYSLIKSSV